MLIDTHIHLDAAAFDPDRMQLLAAARDSGIGAFVVPAVEAANFDGVLALAATEPDIYPALGIHPLFVDRSKRSDLARLDALLGRSEVIALGEIGLDHFVAEPARARQEEMFEAQLELAQQHGLPVLLHSRHAVEAVLQGLRRCKFAEGGIAHAFNGSEQQAAQLLRLGFKLGFGGSLSYPGSRRIRRLACSLPLSAIVLETDAPDMAPLWARGMRNEPANLVQYATILAQLRGIEVMALIAATGDNARQVLGLH